MIALPSVPAWSAWLVTLVLVAACQEYRVLQGRAETASSQRALADFQREVAERDQRAAARLLAETQRRQRVAAEEGEDARKKLQDAQARAATAESAAGGLRGEIARLHARHAADCSTSVTEQRPSGASAIVVLGGLLEEADRMAGSLAAALERSRIAGLACEQVIDRYRAGR